MPDNLTPEQRRYAMSRVKNKDTLPERRVRSELHRRGYRFRKHVQALEGTPDIVFTRAKVAIFIDGDFWHGYHFRAWKHKLTPYWQAKILRNRKRDVQNILALRRAGWRVVRVWTHNVSHDLPDVIARIADLIDASKHSMQAHDRLNNQ